MYSSITPRRSFSRRGVWVLTCIPGPTGVVQLAGVPRAPSISTRHIRQLPNDCMLSVAHSLGMLPPISAAARITLVPLGTVTSRPSTVSVTISADWTSGVPKSAWRSNPIIALRGGQVRRCVDISRFDADLHRRCANGLCEREHRMLSVCQKQRFDRVNGTRGPVTDDRLALDISRRWRQPLEQVLGQADRVDADRQHAGVALVAREVQPGGD